VSYQYPTVHQYCKYSKKYTVSMFFFPHFPPHLLPAPASQSPRLSYASIPHAYFLKFPPKPSLSSPGNERADELAGKAAQLVGTQNIMSLSHIKLRISERFRKAEDSWHADPTHHGTEEIPPPPPKKSMLDMAKNSIARVAAQIRTGHWRSAVYVKRIRKRDSDRCWLCEGLGGTQHRISRAHVLMNCRNPQVASARIEAWGGKSPEAVS
jgi:hypothetical protein